MRNFLVRLVLTFSIATAATAQVLVTNPGLPLQERLTYSDVVLGTRHLLEQTLQLRRDTETTWYELKTQAFDTDQVVKLDPKTLFITSVDSTTRTKDAVLRRQIQVVQVLRQSSANELVVNDLTTLPTVLRGFPWGRVNSAKLVYLGANSASGDYSFELNVLGQEVVVSAGTSYTCWKAQIGLAGIFGPFVSKTTLWYESRPPYILVKLEMPMGGPGSPMRVQELQHYEATAPN